ncbi:MAG: hypothetical protein OER95_16585 [Acidimicrobiia bacterium]|nr:hypothetical protein [Acidimicrobiia bacterium]
MRDPRHEDLDQLLRSLDDLEAEYAAGDLDQANYETLRNDYTVRVADAVRARRSRSGKAAPTPTGPARSSKAIRRLIMVAALLTFAVGVGWLLARSAGERGLGDAMTGDIEPSARQRVVECQELGMTDGLLLESIQCFDEVLATDPQNVEALTYRAWFLILASGSGDDVSADQRAELLDAAVIYLDQAIVIDPGYPDARAFRAVVADRQGDPDQVCSEIGELTALDPPPSFLELTDPVAERNNCG